MVFLLAVVAGAAFGAGDQYLGSLSALPWAAPSSLLSAPWLLLPFTFGWTQVRPRRAVLAGLVATLSALAGYCVMTLTPVEGVHVSADPGAIVALLRSEDMVIAASVITGPLYGFLGYRWRVQRWWVSAVLVAGAVCLEPLAQGVTGHLQAPAAVWIAEAAAGLALSGFFLAAGLVHRRATAQGPGNATPPIPGT